MKTDTKAKILDFINKKQKVRPQDLAQWLGISLVAIHKHLKNLLTQGLIEKIGQSPIVFYQSARVNQKNQNADQIAPHDQDFLEQHYLYVTPEGHSLLGLSGFWEWCVRTKQQKFLFDLVQEYKNIRIHANQFFKNHLWIEAREKLQQTFPEVYLDQIVYQDFYSLPKFGKTKLGQFVLHAKQSQDKKMIHQLAIQIKPVIEKLVQTYRIDALAWLPHSIPRKISFLKELRKDIKSPLPTIDIVKAYAGKIPIAQKSLSKLEERVANAKNTIFIKDQSISHNRILLIDDAVGSGSTLNETALKLRQQNKNLFILGYAIVGSYKGFEVIKEI